MQYNYKNICQNNYPGDGDFVVSLGYEKFEANCNGGKCEVKNIDYDQNLMSKLTNMKTIWLEKSVLITPEIELLNRVLIAIKEMRDLINREYSLGLPELQ
jgi:hypothetical protein